ncbi:MAG: nitrilase-related carbon-nitrogen hydrolase [Bacillota bacterium]
MARVAAAQMQVQIYPTEDAFREVIFRWTARARAAGADLVAFPEGVGAMLVSQYLPAPLVKVLMAVYNETPGQSRGWGKQLLTRVVDKVSGMQDLPKTFNSTVAEHGAALRDSYKRVFAEAARAHSLYVVAGSAYIPDEQTGEIINAAYLFDREGTCLGYQPKVHLYIEDTHVCLPGESVRVFETEFGPIGLPICYEGMFPEVARAMAMKGAVGLVNVSACPGELCFRKIRAGAWSRVQDNQVFGLHACLIGRNDLSKQFTDPYVGRSSVLAPIDLTADYSGVLAEAAHLNQEELVVADWDFDRLRRLWESSDTRVRSEMRVDVLRRMMAEAFAPAEEAIRR